MMIKFPEGVEILAATKSRSVSDIERLILDGIKSIGENYVQEAEKKYRVIGKRVKWHLIGPLQKNKINRALKIFDVIETVDSVELAEELSKKAEKSVEILLQVNAAQEPQKRGCKIEDILAILEAVKKLKHISVRGLMTIGVADNPVLSEKAFKKTKEIFDQVKSFMGSKFDVLSMGMSDDYKLALKYGTTEIRLGRLLFDS